MKYYSIHLQNYCFNTSKILNYQLKTTNIPLANDYFRIFLLAFTFIIEIHIG